MGANRGLARVSAESPLFRRERNEWLENADAPLVANFGWRLISGAIPAGAPADPHDASGWKPQLSYTRGVRVLGIDCGTEVTGYGVVGLAPDTSLHYVAAGAVRLSAREPLPLRLSRVFNSLRKVIELHRPGVVAIEDVFYAVNVKSALKLGQVRGVAMLLAASCGLPVSEYSPLSIKSAVVGYGKADKTQVQHMVARLLRLDKIPEPPDVADALAIAICHLHTAATLDRQQSTVSHPA